MERSRPLPDAAKNYPEGEPGMAAALNEEGGTPLEIDMDRVVSDAEYRRQVIHRLRRERLQAEAVRVRSADAFDLAVVEED